MVFLVRISTSAREERESLCACLDVKRSRITSWTTFENFPKGKREKNERAKERRRIHAQRTTTQFASSVISDENLRGTLADADALTEIFVFEPRSASSSSSAAVANIARIASIASIVVVRIERVKVA